MRRVLKWLGYGAGAALALIIVAIVVFRFTGRARYAETFDVPTERLTARTDSLAVTEGERLSVIHGCQMCHGYDLAGDPFIQSVVFMKLSAPNLTPGEGGLGADYSVEDFERALRHGVNREGRGLIIMPAFDYSYLSDAEVVELFAYVRSLPKVDRAHPAPKVGPIGSAILTFNDELRTATLIDHETPHQRGVDRSDPVALGEYRARICIVCHGESLSGGRAPFFEDHHPSAPNLTFDGATGLGEWSEEDFVRLMRTGVRPDGVPVDSMMPWFGFRRMTDEELSALWTYLGSLPRSPSTAPPTPAGS